MSGTLANHNLYKSKPWVDLDLFCGKVRYGHVRFSLGKSEYIGSSRNFCSLDLKASRYKQLVEFMKLFECSRSRPFLDLGQWSFTIKTFYSSVDYCGTCGLISLCPPNRRWETYCFWCGSRRHPRSFFPTRYLLNQ